MLRIDHVVTGNGLTVAAIRSGGGLGLGLGSDHRPLVADVAVT